MTNLNLWIDEDKKKECDTLLHCARDEAPKAFGGPCDVHGIVEGVCVCVLQVQGVCSHGFPLKGAFVQMTGPEQIVCVLPHQFSKIERNNPK
jgi:hypothetical protein